MVRNTGWLLAGKGVGAVLSLVYLGLAARTLGAVQFGQFTLILGTAQAATGLVGFQTWQIAVRFGPAHLRAGRHDALARLVGFCAAIDVLAALAGCAALAAGFLLLNWPDELARLGLLYCFVALLSVRSTPVGVLRLHDRFGVGAAADAVTPVVRFCGALVVVATGASVHGFLVAWGVAEVATAVGYWVCAGLAAPRALAVPRWRWYREVKAENPGLWRVSWFTNITYTLETGTRQGVLLLVGLATGAVGAGQYRVASQLSQALARVSEMFSRAAFAEMTRADDGRPGHELGRLLRQSTRLTVVAGLLVAVLLIVAGRPALGLLAGPGYADSYPVLLLLGFAAVLDLAGASFEPALVARGLAGLAFWIRAATALCLLAGLAVLLPGLGTVGAGLAVLGSSAVGLLLSAVAVFRHFRVSPLRAP